MKPLRILLTLALCASLPFTLASCVGEDTPSSSAAASSRRASSSGDFNGGAFIVDGQVTGRNGVKYPYDKIPTNSGGYAALQELCHHFWGNEVKFSSWEITGSQVDGVVVAYRAWVKEESMAGKLVATVGCDIKGEEDHQVFSGFNYALTTQPRWIVGHNLGPKTYDAIMDSEQVQKLIGMK